MPNYRNKNKNRRNKNRNKNNNQNKDCQETQQQDKQPTSTKTATAVHDNVELKQQLGCIPNVPVQANRSTYDDDIITAHITPPAAAETHTICNASEHSPTSEVSCTEQSVQESTTTGNAVSIGTTDTVSRDPPNNIERLPVEISSNITTPIASLAEECPIYKMGANNSKQQFLVNGQTSSPTTGLQNQGAEMKTISITRQQGKVIVHRVVQEATISTSEDEVSSVSSYQDENDPKVVVHQEPCPEQAISEEKATVTIHQEDPDIMTGKHQASTQQPKVIMHKIAFEQYRVDSPQPIELHKPKTQVLKILPLDRDDEENQLQIQEISDNSSGCATDNQPLISEAESDSDDDRVPTEDANNNGELPKPIISNQENYKQRRAQKRAAIENHFLPQFLSPRYLDSILEENSDMSDARSEKSDMALSHSTSDNYEDDQLDDEHESKTKRANAVFPKSNLDFSKKHKHGTVPKVPTLPTIIREETVPMIVEAKIIEQPIITERCSTWSSAQTPESEAAEVVYINSASSSISDLLELDYEENADDNKRSTIDLDTDVSEIFAKPSKANAAQSQINLNSDQRERTPVNETSSPMAIVVDRTQSTSTSAKTIQTTTNTYTEKIANERIVKKCKTSSQNANSNEQLLAANKNISSSTHTALVSDDCNNEEIEKCEISENYALAEAAGKNVTTSPTSSVSIANDNAQNSEIFSNSQMNDLREILNSAANESSANVSEVLEQSSTPIVPRRVAPPLPTLKGSSHFHNDPPPPIPPPPQTYNQLYENLNFRPYDPISTHDDPTLTIRPQQQPQLHLSTTSSSTKPNTSSPLTRQESGDSHGSDSTTNSQCTAINLGSLTHFDCADFDAESSVSGGISAPTTDSSVTGDHSVNLDSSEAESTIFLDNFKDTSDSSIKKLRLLCTETLASMPYGEDILEELATVAQNIGELRATKTLSKLSEMPYPLPNLPHITDIQVSTSCSNSRKPANVTLTQVPPIMTPEEKLASPPPPPVPKPPSKYDSWLGVPTESDPNVLVCLSPSQRSFITDDKTSTGQKPDHLLDAHKKFLERRGYHEYTAEQVNAINMERTAENQIIQTAAMMKQLRKSLTPPPLPPPPVPRKSSDTTAKAQKQQQQYEQKKNQNEKQEAYDNSSRNRITNEQRSLFDNEDENKHRLLAIIHDNTNETKQNRSQAAASSASSSSNENNSRQTSAQAELTASGKEAHAHSSAGPLIQKQEHKSSTSERLTDFANGSLSSKKSEHIDTSSLQTKSSTYTRTSSSTKEQGSETKKQLSDSLINNEMQGIDAEFSKLFPALGNTDIFDSAQRRFSNIEIPIKEPLSTHLTSKQTKRFSNIETSSYESKKCIENGHVVFDVSDSKREIYTDGDKPDASIFQFPVSEKIEPLHEEQQLNTAASTQETSHTKSTTENFTPTDFSEIMSALNINTSTSATEAQVSPPQKDPTLLTFSHLKTNKESKEQFEKTIFRQNSENSTFNKNISGTYEEFRQRAKAAAEAVSKPLTAPLTSNGDHHQPKSSFHFDHEKLFKDFDELSKQLNFELESGKAKKEHREKSTSLFDLSRIQNESKSRFEELKRQRHEHMQELEHEIERSRRARQFRIPNQLQKDIVQPSYGQKQIESKSRTVQIPIHVENESKHIHSEPNKVVKEARTYDIPVHVEPGYTVTSPTPKAITHHNDRFRRAESMFNLSETQVQQNNAHRQCLDDYNGISNIKLDDWTRYAKDSGSSENISRPFAREVEICYQRSNPNSIRAPRMTVSTNDLTTTNHSYDSFNAYNARRTHAPMLNQAPQKTKPQYLSCHSMIERDPNPTYISTTSRRGVSPAPPTIQANDSSTFSYSHGNEARQQRRASLPREIHEQQLKYITSKEQELKTEFERLENERRRLLEEINRATPIMPIPSPRTFRPTSKLPTLSEEEVFRQQMAEEWLNKVAEREERRLQKIIKISKINEEASQNTSAQPACPKTDIGNEFLKRVKERRSKLAMPSDSDWESGAESHPIIQGNLSENEDVPPVKIIEGRSETDLRQLPKHMREFAKFSNHEREELDGGHREVHQEEERRQESKDNSMSSAVKKSSIVKTYKVSRVPGIQTFNAPSACPSKTSSRMEIASKEEALNNTSGDSDFWMSSSFATQPSLFNQMSATPLISMPKLQLPASFSEMFAASPFKKNIYEEFDNFWRNFDSA